MNLEDIMLNEISQSQKNKFLLIPLHEYLMWSNPYRHKVLVWWVPGLRNGEWEALPNEGRVSAEMMKSSEHG